MIFTSKKPHLPGAYWIKGFDLLNPNRAALVQVASNDLNQITVNLHGFNTEPKDQDSYLVSELDSEFKWCGPLLPVEMMQKDHEKELYYLQDARSYVGNDILFWAKNGAGYTTDLNRAEVYTREEAVKQNQCRETDIPWPKSYIDSKRRPAVDMQYTDIDEALAGTGIALKKEPKPKKETFRCHNCGAFISEQDFWGGYCKRCGEDSRP